MKTPKTLNKKRQSKSGLSVKAELQNLNTSISLTKGLLAILLSKQQSRSTKKSQTMDPANLRILLQDAMDEIWNADQSLMKLQLVLEKKYMGICLL